MGGRQPGWRCGRNLTMTPAIGHPRGSRRRCGHGTAAGAPRGRLMGVSLLRTGDGASWDAKCRTEQTCRTGGWMGSRQSLIGVSFRYLRDAASCEDDARQQRADQHHARKPRHAAGDRDAGGARQACAERLMVVSFRGPRDRHPPHGTRQARNRFHACIQPRIGLGLGQRKASHHGVPTVGQASCWNHSRGTPACRATPVACATPLAWDTSMRRPHHPRGTHHMPGQRQLAWANDLRGPGRARGSGHTKATPRNS